MQVAGTALSPGCVYLLPWQLSRPWDDVVTYKNQSAAAAVMCWGCLDGDNDADGDVFQKRAFSVCIAVNQQCIDDSLYGLHM